MTKRIISLVLVCILAIPIIAVPASATTVEEQILDFLVDDDTPDWDLAAIWDANTRMIVAALDAVKQAANTQWTLYRQEFDDYVTEFKMFVTSLGNLLNQYLGNIDQNLVAFQSSVSVWFSDTYDAMVSWFSDTVDAISSAQTAIVNKLGVFQNIIYQAINPRLDAIKNAITGTTDQKTEAEEQEQQAVTQATEFEDFMEQMQEATRPEYEDIDVSVDSVTNGKDITGYSQGLRQILDQTLFVLPLFMASMFAAISFVVFGKR